MFEYDDAMRVMVERFGHDCLIALATLDGGRPSVRTVDGYFEDGAFYVVTHAESNKMRQIEDHPSVGVSGEWFSGHGVAEDLGGINEDANAGLMSRVGAAFAGWLRVGGHVDPHDPHNRLLRIRLTDGVLMVNGERYAIDFVARSV